MKASKRILKFYLSYLKKKAKNEKEGDKAIIRFLSKRMYKAPFKELIENVFYETMDQFKITKPKNEFKELLIIWNSENNILNLIETDIDFPSHLNDAHVLEFVILDLASNSLFNRISNIVEEDEYTRQIKFLAICRYDNDLDPQNYHLFHINRYFNVIWETSHFTFTEAKEQAESEFPGTLNLWQNLKPKSP